MTQASPADTGLSRGTAIGYKAYTRTFEDSNGGSGTAAVVLLLASCYYDSSGWTIFFEGNLQQLSLMEQNPTGIVREMVTYYAASWTTSFRMSDVPAEITVTDAFGDHVVPVEQWTS
jgi:hypothetical protein